MSTPFEVTPLLPGEPIRQTSVSVVDHKIDAGSDTIGVQLQRENADYAIPGGIRCDVEFSPLDAATTPSSVVRRRADMRRYVFSDIKIRRKKALLLIEYIEVYIILHKKK